MTKDERIKQAARTLGSLGGKKPRVISDQTRAWRREWARGLAALRKQKREQAKGQTT